VVPSINIPKTFKLVIRRSERAVPGQSAGISLDASPHQDIGRQKEKGG